MTTSLKGKENMLWLKFIDKNKLFSHETAGYLEQSGVVSRDYYWFSIFIGFLESAFLLCWAKFNKEEASE